MNDAKVEIAHLRTMVATLEIRLAQQNTILEASRLNETRCEKHQQLEGEVRALSEQNEWLWGQRDELVARVIALNDAAFAKAFVERHAEEVMKRRAP